MEQVDRGAGEGLVGDLLDEAEPGVGDDGRAGVLELARVHELGEAGLDPLEHHAVAVPGEAEDGGRSAEGEDGHGEDVGVQETAVDLGLPGGKLGDHGQRADVSDEDEGLHEGAAVDELAVVAVLPQRECAGGVELAGHVRERRADVLHGSSLGSWWNH